MAVGSNGAPEPGLYLRWPYTPMYGSYDWDLIEMGGVGLVIVVFTLVTLLLLLMCKSVGRYGAGAAATAACSISACLCCTFVALAPPNSVCDELGWLCATAWLQHGWCIGQSPCALLATTTHDTLMRCPSCCRMKPTGCGSTNRRACHASSKAWYVIDCRLMTAGWLVGRPWQASHYTNLPACAVECHN